MMKVLWAGPSTTLTGTPAARAAAAITRAFVPIVVGDERGSGMSRGQSRSAAMPSSLTRPAATRLRISGQASSAKTRTCARRPHQQPQLLRRLLAAASDDDGAVVEIEEDREVPQIHAPKTG